MNILTDSCFCLFWLFLLFDISVQDDRLDSIIAAHRKKLLGYKMVVVEGGGLVGMMSTVMLYRAGYIVHMVEKRSVASRSHIMLLPDNFYYFLKTFLGADWPAPKEPLLHEVENTMRDRMNKLADKTDGHLSLHFGVEIIHIDLPSKMSPFFTALLANKAVIPFILLVFAGGRKDKFRNFFLGILTQYTVTEYYGRAVFHLSQNQADTLKIKCVDADKTTLKIQMLELEDLSKLELNDSYPHKIKEILDKCINKEPNMSSDDSFFSVSSLVNSKNFFCR